MTYKKIIRNSWLFLPVCIIISFILYLPTIGRSFLSDDYLVLRRVALDRVLLIKGFFRPLSDLTIFINYLIGGFNPAGYYIFAILLHGLNGFLLFKFCERWKWTTDNSLQGRYALIAAVLFLCYPFHNESIVWLLGRASSMASTFGMLALLFLVSDLPEKIKIILVCLCFFTGLTSYESIMVLPMMVLIILFKRDTKWHGYITWTLALVFTFILHLIIRVKISGVIAGSYGEGFFTLKLFHYFSNIFKVTGRLFLPPVQSGKGFSILLAILIASLIYLTITTWRRISNRPYFLKIYALIITASIIPILFSVSTKTSESDRFLHFPSFFICCFVSFVLVHLITQLNKLLLSTLLITSYCIFFLEKNNSNWIKASDISKNIIATIKENIHYRKLYIINLPEEYNGAYIFRLGFKDALVINSIDTSKIMVVNRLKRDQMLWFPTLIRPAKRGAETDIPPYITITKLHGPTEIQLLSDNHIYLNPTTESELFYWNNQELMKLQEVQWK